MIYQIPTMQTNKHQNQLPNILTESTDAICLLFRSDKENEKPVPQHVFSMPYSHKNKIILHLEETFPMILTKWILTTKRSISIDILPMIFAHYTSQNDSSIIDCKK